MPDIIHLLPESVANQIAAGEVVQRPASVVKELMENSIDAEATIIQLIVKDAGKTLIQVVDNGKGMSETDARMCFERHATSKIKKTEDLFHIHTKGFRGEALASIAAVAQVEMKTKQQSSSLGTLVSMEGSKVKQQEAIQSPVGTNFSVKNLFYNVPARRYFLKSEPIEFRHIIEEFQRVALTHPEIEFNLIHNGTEVSSLPSVPLRQRIVHVFGNRYNEKLVPVEEQTDIVEVCGFIGKPETSKKTRGEQFFFINNRFIKNAYLHHAVMSAYQQLLPAGHFPLYLLYLTIDPELIDINIHPTKTEIKFQDERAVYAIVHAATRRALGKFNISPSLDFDQESSIQISPVRTGQEIIQPKIDINPEFNPFENLPLKQKRESSLAGWFDKREKSAEGWKELLEVSTLVTGKDGMLEKSQIEMENEQISADLELNDEMPVLQLMRKYIVSASPKGLMLIDQQRAHQRILFEKFFSQLEKGQGHSQQLLFPESISLGSTDYILVQQNLNDLQAIGFSIILLIDSQIEVVGIPAECELNNTQRLLEEFLEQWKNESNEPTYSPREQIAWALAYTSSIRYGQMLTEPEMHGMVEQLMHCSMPYASKNNKPTLISLSQTQLEQQFR